MVAQFRVVNSGLDFIIVIIIMSNFLVVLGCSDDDSVSLSSLTVPVMSVSVSPANSSSLEPIKRCNCTKFKLLMIFMLWSGCCSLLLGSTTKPQCSSMHWLHKIYGFYGLFCISDLMLFFYISMSKNLKSSK